MNVIMEDPLSATQEESEPSVIYITEDRPDWTDESTREFLKIYDEKIDMLDSGIITTHKKIWELISKEMAKKGYYFSPAHCENKWKTLKRTYKTRHDINRKSGTFRKHCPFESEIAEIFRKRPQEITGRNNKLASESPKKIKLDLNNDEDDVFNIDFNTSIGYNNEDIPRLEAPDTFVVQESGPLLEELSQLRQTMSKSSRFQAHILRQSLELQQKIVKHLDNCAQRESNSLKLQQAMIEQQNEIIKQMRLQNNLLQNLVDKNG